MSKRYDEIFSYGIRDESNIKKDGEERHCDYFNMSGNEFESYKRGKKTRILIYIAGMIIATLFTNALACYITFTIMLILTYKRDARFEEQWIKDGAIKREDLDGN